MAARRQAPPGPNGEAPAGWNPVGASEDSHADSRTEPKHSAGLPERQQRALLALLRGPQTRNDIDTLCAVSNGPDLIWKLRALGLQIDMTMRPGLNRFGRAIRHGVYDLRPGQGARIARLLLGQTVDSGGGHG